MKISPVLILFLSLSPWFLVAELPSRSARIKAAMADPARKTVLIAAHRGGYANDKDAGAPENSVANVEVAVARGFDLYETDIQRTRDGVFVVMHDETIERETTGEGRVGDLTLSDLKALRKRFRDGSVSEEPVATLEELLVAGKTRLLFKADLKPGLTGHFGELAALIHALGMQEDVFIRCSRHEAELIEAQFAKAPRVEVMVKVDSAAQVRSVAGRFTPKTIQINVEKGEVLTPGKRAAITAAGELGILVETHAYSDPAQWEELIGAGVRMFHTASPDATLRWLVEKGRKEE